MNKKQKRIISTLSIVTLGILGTALYFTYAVKKNQDYTGIANDLMINEGDSRQLDQLNMLKDSTKAYNNLTFMPKKNNASTSQAFFNQVASANDALYKKQRLKKQDMIITDVTSNKTTLNVNDVTIKETVFQWKDKQFSKGATSQTQLLLSKKTNEPVTLKDLFKTPDRLKKFELILKQAMLDQTSQSDKEVDAILQLTPLTFNDTNCQITPDGISYTFDKNKYFVESVTIPFTDLSHTLAEDIFPTSNKQTSKKNKQVALTFDDGPGPETTHKLLGILKEADVTATFFMLGRSALNFPDAAKEVADAGHTIGSHSYTHELLTKETKDEIRQQDLQADKAIYQATGVLPKVFRPPYGGVDKTVADIIEKPMIQWDLDTMDWQLKDSEAITNQVMTYVQDGSIILIHDIHKESVDAIPEVITTLQNDGFDIVSIDELLTTDVLPGSQYFSAHGYSAIKADK